MKVLFYKPFMVYNPRVVRMIEEIETEIQKGNEIFFIGCNGELIDGCLDNPLRSKIACASCKYFRKHDLSLLSKKIKTYSISDFLSLKKPYKLDWQYNNVNEIKKLEYKGVDVGYAALSAYIQLTRNHIPKITSEFKTFFNRYLDTGAYVTDFISEALDKIQPDLVNVFNARIHSRRPVLRVCQQKKINCNVLEHTGIVNNRICKKIVFKNCLPQDITFNTQFIKDTWNNSKLLEDEKIRVSSEFYLKQSKGVFTTHKSFVKGQKLGLLPKNWDSKKKNIVIYNSSDDEMASLGFEWEFKLSHSKVYTIERMLENFLEKDFHFYLRIHPNLGGLRYNYLSELYNLNSYKNITIIAPESKISSYELLKKCDKAVSFGSSMGIEAVFWGKPSILLGSSMYMNLGSNYIPKTHDELFEMIEQELPPKDKKAALMFIFFRLFKGKDFKYFNPNYDKLHEIKVKNKLIVSFNNNYREARYKIIFPVLRNFIKYKQHSIPKNLWMKLNKKFIPKLDE